MVALVLGLAAIVLFLAIVRIADGEGTAAIFAHLLLKFLAGVIILIILALAAAVGYFVLSAPHSPVLI